MTREKGKQELVTYFAQKPEEFYKRDIFNLVYICNEILGSDGDYLND